MSMTDLKWTFSDGQLLTSVGTVDCDNPVDIGRVTPKIGGGTPLWVNVQVGTKFASGGSATLQVTLETGATVGGDTQLWQSQAWAVADCIAGKVLASIPLPSECLQFLLPTYAVAASAMTSGDINAWIGTSPIYDP